MEVVSPQSIFGTIPTPSVTPPQLDLAETHLLRQEHVWLHGSHAQRIPGVSRATFRATTGFFRFFIQAHRLGLLPDGATKTNFIVAAHTAMERLEELSPDDLHFFWPDTISMMISQFGTCLYKAREYPLNEGNVMFR